MKAKIVVFASILFLSGINTSVAQEIITTRDMGLRAGVGLDYKPWKHYKLSLQQEIRTTNNSKQLDKLITDIGLMYEIDKQFTIGGDLRYQHKRQEDYSYSNDIRYNLDLKFKQKINDSFRFKYRMRYQQKFGNLLTSDRDNIETTDTNFRNKFEVEYRLNNHLYYVNAELFRKYKQYQKPYFNKVRYYLGKEFKYKNGKINLCLGYEKNIGDWSYPHRFYFIETNYTFKRKLKQH